MEPKTSISAEAVDDTVMGAMNAPSNPTGIAWRLNFLANFYIGPLYKEIEERHGLSRPEYIVLFCLYQVPGLLARDIVRLCGRPKNSISRAVNANLARKLITEAPEAGRRGIPLRLTADGDALVRQIVPLFVAREATMLATLSDSERTLLDQLLRKLALRRDGWDTPY
jgi:MarR family transcriptional regulator, temperature-dependent positive regulator of motility